MQSPWLKKIAVSMLVALSGCGFSEFTDRTTNPVVLDLLRDRDFWTFTNYRYQTVSTDAGRRTIFVRYRQNDGRADFVCAEPPPDALQAYTNAIAAAIKEGGATGASLNLSRELSTSAAPLLYRSQGLQLLRDQMFNLCLMLMNGTLKPDAYNNRVTSLIAVSAELIKLEQNALTAAATRSPTIVNAKQAPASNSNPSTPSPPNTVR